MSNRTVKAIVLYSRKGGTDEWFIRNDRLYDRDGGLESSLVDADRQLTAWQGVEPFSEFKIEVEFYDR